MAKGDQRFHDLLYQLGELHDRKQADYGTDGDPFANIRGSEEWGIPAWKGALVRANDKMHRLQEFARKGVLANESAEDSMMDLAVYAMIALILYREASGNVEATTTSTTESVKDAVASHLVDTCHASPEKTRSHKYLRINTQTLKCVYCKRERYSDAFG